VGDFHSGAVLRYSAMHRDAFKTMIWLLPELIVLAVLLHYSLEWSIFFSVFMLLYFSCWQMHFLRKMIRCFLHLNDLRMFAIIERLNITDEELNEVGKRRARSSATEAQLREMERDFADIGL
jgi:hypothetical protein